MRWSPVAGGRSTLVLARDRGAGAPPRPRLEVCRRGRGGWVWMFVSADGRVRPSGRIFPTLDGARRAALACAVRLVDADGRRALEEAVATGDLR